MTKEIAISLLSKSKTGEKILQILDTIANGIDDHHDSQSGILTSWTLHLSRPYQKKQRTALQTWWKATMNVL